MATVRELQASFIAKAAGMKSTIQGIKKDINDLAKDTRKSSDSMGKSFSDNTKSMTNTSSKFGGAIRKISGEASKSFDKIGTSIQSVSVRMGDWSKDIKQFGKTTSKALSPLTAFYATAAITGGKRMIENEQLDILMKNTFRTKEAYDSAWESIKGLTKGTAFMNKDVGQWLSQLVQSNVELGKSEDIVGSILDFAVGSGQLGIEGEIQEVIMKAIRAGGWDQMTLDMLAQRGLNLAGHISNVLGIEQSAAQDMLKDGTISMEESLDYFVDAVQVGSEGAGGYFAKMAGSAQKGGETMTGAWVNTKAAIAQLGEDMWKSGAWDQLKTALNNFTDFIYQLAPALEPTAKIIASVLATAVEWIQKLMTAFINLRPKTQALIAGLSVIGAVLGPAIYLFGSFVGAISKALAPIGTLFTWLSKVFGAIAGKTGLTGALKALTGRFSVLFGPIGIAIGIITTLASIFMLAYKRSETFRNFVQKLGATIKENFGKFMEWVQPGIDAVAEFFGEIKEKISEFIGKEGPSVIEAFQNIRNFVKPILEWLGDKISWLFDKVIKATILYVMPYVEGIIKTAWSGIKSIITGTLDIIMGAVKVFSGLFTGDWSKMWEGIKQIGAGLIKIIWGMIKTSFFGRIIGGAIEFAKSYIKKITEMWKKVQRIFTDTIVAVYNYFKKSFVGRIITNIINFSKNFRENISKMWSLVKNMFTKRINEIRNSIANSFVGRIISSITTLKTRFVNIAKDMWAGVRKQFNNIVSGAKGLPKRIGDGIRSARDKATSGMKSVGNSIIRWAGKPFNKVVDGVNWITGKLGIKSKISTWNYPQYAKGTKGSGHPGGPAVVGDGPGRELVQLPDGNTFVSPDTDTLVDLPKGTHVVPNKQTEKILKSDVPYYAKGTIGKIGNFLGKTAKKTKDVASDVWEYASNPGKLVSKIMDGISIIKDKAQIPTKIVSAGFNYLKNKPLEFIKKKFSESGGGKPAFGWPITSPFGYRTHPITGARKLHGGTDFGAPAGSPIPSTTGGTVSYAGGGWNGGFGNLVKVRQGMMEYFYAHMSKIIARVGQAVKKGDILGLVGSTGASTGPHLHYEARRNGVRMDPMKLKGYADGGIINSKQLAWIAEGGWAESIISHDPSKRVRQQRIWQETGDRLGFTDDKYSKKMLAELERIAKAVEEGHGHDIIVNDRILGEAVEPHVTHDQNRRKRRKRRASN